MAVLAYVDLRKPGATLPASSLHFPGLFRAGLRNTLPALPDAGQMRVTNRTRMDRSGSRPTVARSASVKLLRALILTLGLALAAPIHATHDDLRSIKGLRDHYRVLIVFTPSLHDARLAAQRAIMARLALEAAKRDLLFVQVDPMTAIGASDNPDKLRRSFGVPVHAYHAILHAIDITPTRRNEVKRARMGKPIVDKG